MPTIEWAYFPRNVRPPDWSSQLMAVVEDVAPAISTAEASTGLSSDAVLGILRPGMAGLGYEVESGKKASQKVVRPVLFGDNGRPSISYELDAFHSDLNIAVEVEAGRAASNNADFRNIVRTSLVLDADYLVMLVPLVYRSQGSEVRVFDRTRSQLEAIYASERLQLPFHGVLVAGY